MKLRVSGELGVCGEFGQKIAVLSLLFLALAPLGWAQAPQAAARITQPVDESVRVTLHGNTHPLARPQFDQGAAADSQPMRRMLLLLKRGDGQEAALKNLIEQQQTKSSASYHQWLTPQQFGQQFGPADADVQTITTWLQSHGFQVAGVNAGRTMIEFSGNAGQVRSAFQTEIHRYVVNGQEHLANNSDPQIPAALAPVVAGPVSLHNFPKHALSRQRGVFSRSAETGRVQPMLSGTTPPPNSASFNALGPADFAKIYNVPTGTNGNPNGGSGQTIAIVSDSEICAASSPDWMTSYMGPLGEATCNVDDVAQFRSAFNLPANSPNVILDGPDPSFNADETEGDLDVEWAGAVAPFATIDFVVAEDTEATFGVDLAAEYVVDNNLAPAVSESFGECEADLEVDENLFYYDLWEQAIAQGITPIVAAGDNGSAGCDDENLISPNGADSFGAGVNGIASTPFNVAAGGTDFDTTNSSYVAGNYWSSTNNTTTLESAKSYIPETSWNDSCAQNFTGSLTTCNGNPQTDTINIVAGSGGQSNCVNSEFDNAGNFLGCSPPFNSSLVTGYVRPSWQSGSYVADSSDGVRMMPDISLFAADGFVSNSFYAVCEADFSTTCITSDGSLNNFLFLGVGGTSSSAPGFAGIMALVNQKTGARQGNANYVLYNLANQQWQAGLSCNSSSSPSSQCTFYDITRGNNSVACVGTSVGCKKSTNSGTYGVLEQSSSTSTLSGTLAFPTASGYDLATGLGTINVGNLLNNWSNATFTATSTTLCMWQGTAPACPTTQPTISITHGTAVSVNIQVKNGSNALDVTDSLAKPEAASLIGACAIPVQANCAFAGSPSQSAGVDHFTSNNYIVANNDVEPLDTGATTFSTEYLVGGTYSVTARYAGDGTNGASSSTNPIVVTVTPEGSTTTLAAGLVNFISGAVGTAPAQVYYGDAITLRADVVGLTSGQENATGTVTFTDTGSGNGGNSNLGASSLNTEGYTEDQTGSNVDGVSNIPALGVGTHVITAAYGGDNSYNASPTSAAVSFTVVAAPTTTSITASANNLGSSSTSLTVPANTQVTLAAFIDTASVSGESSGGSSGTPPTGTVTFINATTSQPINTIPVSVMGTADTEDFVAGTASYTFTPSATVSVEAVYTPSASIGEYQGSTSSPVALSTGPGVSQPSAGTNCNTFTIALPGQPSSGCLITVSAVNSFTGAVTLGYSVIGFPQNAVDLPTCSYTPSATITLTSTATSGSATLTCSSTAPASVYAPRPRSGPSGRPWPWAVAIVSLACAFFVFTLPKRRRWGFASLAVLLALVVGAAVSCGGGSSTSTTSTGGVNPGTTIGAYTISISATPSSGSAPSPVTVTLNVN